MMQNLPDIYIFNPTCEMAIANGTVSYMPPENLRQFETEACVLPMYFAQKQDIVLCTQLPDFAFVQKMTKLGFDLPFFLQTEQALASIEFVEQAKNRLLPWGWSAAMHHKMRGLKSSCSQAFRQSPVADWKIEYKQLYSRKAALHILQSILNNCISDFYIDRNEIPEVCQSIEEVEQQLNGRKNIVVKAPFSSSGRGLLFLRNGELKGYKLHWLEGILKTTDYVMVETLLDVVQNISFHYHIENQKVTNIGISTFHTTSNGQYLSSNINNHFTQLTENLQIFVHQTIGRAQADVNLALQKSNFAKLYEGFLGVDALLFTDRSGSLKIQPCLEINLRYNMGLLALILEKKLHPHAKGTLNTAHFKAKDYHLFCAQNEATKPVVIRDGKIAEGFFSLIPYSEKNRFGVWVDV